MTATGMMNPIPMIHDRRPARWAFWSLCLVVLASAFCSASELQWSNGEWIGGDFVGIEAGHTIWKTPMFGEPVRVRLDALKRVNRFKLDEKTTEPFSIRLVDGSRLYGTIVGLDADVLELKSPRYGTLRVKRDAVHSVQRLQAEGMLYAQPMSPEGWTEGALPTGNNNGKPVAYWRPVPGASLKQVGWNRTVTLPVEVPEKVEMQFILTSTVRPEFKAELKASTAPGQQMVVETWVDDLVLQGQTFQSLKHLEEKDHRVKLTLFWNRTTGQCAVYVGEGKKIAEITPPVVEAKKEEKAKPQAKPAGPKVPKVGGLFGALVGVVQGAVEERMDAIVDAQVRAANPPRPPGDAPSPVGFTLLNKGPDLKLEGLRIRTWDGTLPTDITEARPRVELTDSHYLKAAPVRASATALTVRDEKGQETSLPWDKVLAIEMGPVASPFFQIGNPSVELWFTDGEWVQGVLHEVRNETAVLKTTFSDTPVSFKITRMHHLQLRGYQDGIQLPGLAQLDKLTLDKKVLHGTLDASGGTQPRWLPVGGLEPVTIVPKGEMEIARAPSAPTESIHSEALFYLGNGDVLPGKLRAIDSTRVDFESPLTAVKLLPSTKMQAIQFGGRALNLEGFEDTGWQRVRGSEETVKRNGKAGLNLEPGGSWGHPAFMQVNDLGFTLQSDGFNALRVRLFCEGVNPAAPSVNLLFGHMGNEVCFGLETAGDQMDRQFRVRSGDTMPVRLTVDDNSVEVFFNGVSARKIPITAKMRSGSGIIVEPFSLWGNGEHSVKLTAFNAHVAPGRIAAPAVEPRSKEHALTVPRFRKEDPPTHALLAANGDLLRGVIEAATANHFSLRSGLENIQVPRDRVKAAVWLVKPVDDVNAAFEARAKAEDPPTITHWLLLNNGGRLALKVERFAEDAVMGTSELLGACRVPLPQIHAIRSKEPSDTSAMMALRDWKLKFAPEPVLPQTGGESSPLLNKDAKTFRLPLLAGGDFDLAKEKGKVIVLDFWATWCGPCIKSLPEMIDEMSALDAGKVRFIGVNQAEAKEQVKTFLETRGWKFEVAFDANQRVGQSFGVEGIPHTVVIGPDGKVAYVKTGYEPDGAKKVAEMVKKLLGDKTAEPSK